MKTYLNLNRYSAGSGTIAPPFRPLRSIVRSVGVMLLLFLLSHSAQAQSLTLTNNLAFIPGTATFVQPEIGPVVAKEVLEYYALHNAEVVLVNVRTTKPEVVAEGISNYTELQRARAQAIKDLFVKAGHLQFDEFQVHSSIAFRGEPAEISWELRMHDGKMATIPSKGPEVAGE